MKATRWSRPRSTARPSRFETRIKREENGYETQTADPGPAAGARAPAPDCGQRQRARRACGRCGRAAAQAGPAHRCRTGDAFAAPRSSPAARSPPSRSALQRCTAGCIRPSSRRRSKRRSSPSTPASMRCRRPWTPWPRPRASRPTRRTRAKSTAADGTQKSSVSDRKRSFFIWFLSFRPAIR